ncbi:MAG: hypothetical protein HQ552_00680 [Desulfobacteraceae bacterium]|nr:hypothetical protein [Desulfobacteraceae bacterium]
MIQINRGLTPGQYKIADIFPEIIAKPILAEIFRSKQEIENVIANTKVIIINRHHEMSVDNQDGTITIGLNHLQQSDTEILYLDIIHELVHVRQQRDGLDLYDKTKAYVDRLTEIDAYALTVKEARRIGFTEAQILNYLQVEWITPQEHRRLAKRLDVEI